MVAKHLDKFRNEIHPNYSPTLRSFTSHLNDFLLEASRSAGINNQNDLIPNVTYSNFVTGDNESRIEGILIVF